MATRGGRQQGGAVSPLEDVALGMDPGEEDDPSLVTGALEAAVRPPADLPTQSRRRGRMNNTEAMKTLQEARQRLVDRRTQLEEGRGNEFLAFASGMLAPTRTGGFGESLGMAVERLGEARTDRREALTEIEQSLLDAEVRRQALEMQARPRIGAEVTVYHPDDVANRPNDSDSWRQIQATQLVHSDGSTENVYMGQDGELLQVVSKSNPITVGDVKSAQDTAADEVKLRTHEIEQGLTGTIAITRLRRAREMFDRIATSGLKTDIARLARYLNVPIADNADLDVIRNLIGKDIISQLQLLTGTKTDFEFRKIEEMNASERKSREANLAIIDNMMRSLSRTIEIGERAALARAGDNANEDLNVRRYRDFRAAEAERERLADQARVEGAKIAPREYDDRLVNTFGEFMRDPAKRGQLPQLIEAYKRRGFTFPPADPEVMSNLRRQGFREQDFKEGTYTLPVGDDLEQLLNALED